MQIDTQELAPFRSANAALAFAFNFTHGTLEQSAMARLYQTPPGIEGSQPGEKRLVGLSGIDLAGQAGIIKGEVSRLDPRIRGQILTARFAVRHLPCSCRHSCCSGYRPNNEWQLAICDIAEDVHAEALVNCSSNFTLRHAIVRRYFGVHQSLTDAAAAAGVDRDTASAHASRVIAYLHGEERLAKYEIDGKLKAAGIVA